MDWQNAYVSNSKSMLLDYLSKHPDSPHKALAAQKIDSLDWAQASSLNTIEAYQAYLAEHQDGDHYNEAEENMKALKVKEVSAEERSMIGQLFRHFFVSINERNETGLVSCVADELTLLDKEQEDVQGRCLQSDLAAQQGLQHQQARDRRQPLRVLCFIYSQQGRAAHRRCQQQQQPVPYQRQGESQRTHLGTEDVEDSGIKLRLNASSLPEAGAGGHSASQEDPPGKSISSRSLPALFLSHALSLQVVCLASLSDVVSKRLSER